MQEAILVLDLQPGAMLRNGMSVLAASERICKLFGGCSFSIGGGCWWHEMEYVFDPHVKFSVAMDVSAWLTFTWVAMELAAGQETVYLVDPQGRVEILDVVSLDELPGPARAFLEHGDFSDPIEAWFTTAPGGEFDAPT